MDTPATSDDVVLINPASAAGLAGLMESRQQRVQVMSTSTPLSDGTKRDVEPTANIAEPTSFTEEERASALSRSWLNSWLPVLVDLSWDRVRSRLGVTLVLIQVATKLVLQTYLPRYFLLPSVVNCAGAASSFAAMGVITGIDVQRAAIDSDSFGDIFLYLYYTYFVLSLLALHSWNWPIYLLPATAIAWVTLGWRSAYELPWCLLVARISPPAPVDLGSDSPYTGCYSTVVAFYNTYSWVATFVVAVELTRLAALAVIAALRGEHVGWFVSGEYRKHYEANANACLHDPESCVAPPVRPSQVNTLQPWMSWDHVVHWYRLNLCCVPLRHLVATGLSSVAILYFSLFFTSWMAYCLGLVASARVNFETLRASSLPPDAPDIMKSLFLLFISASGVVESTLNTLRDIFTYAPYGLLAVALVMASLLIYSLFVIIEQHRQLLCRYKAPPSLGALKVDETFERLVLVRTTAPDLRRFSFFSAIQYIVIHLVVHLLVAILVAAVATIVITVAVVYSGGFPALFTFIGVALRTQVYNLAVLLVPWLFVNVCVPALTALGLDVRGLLLNPARRAYMCACFCFRFDDGPLIFLPRVFLLVDLALSATLGVVLGTVDGLTRIGIALTWGLVRCALLCEPVVPPIAMQLDRPFMAYGSMLRSAHAELLPFAAPLGSSGPLVPAR